MIDEVERARPLAEQLGQRFAQQPEARAVFADGIWRTYGELQRDSCRLRAWFREAGIGPGQRLGVMANDRHRFLDVWLATIADNVVLVPINTGLVGEGLRDVIERSELHGLLVERSLANTVSASGVEVAPGKLWHIEDVGGRCGRAERFSNSTVQPDDPAVILFTSGTTGPSKGVVLSRRAQLWHGANYLRDFIRLGPGEVGYSPLPLFHVSAQGFTLGCLLGGAAVVLEPFNPFSCWRLIREHEVKAANYVGTMIPVLMARPPSPTDRDHPLLRAVGTATAPDLHEPFEQRFGVTLTECYGQTEMAGLWLAQDPSDRRIGTAGRPVRWFEAAIQDERGDILAADTVGEIVIRPECDGLIFDGYFRAEAATRHAFRDSWYHTGDAGEMDAAGNLTFRGRLKDFMRVRGENVSAFEVERAALSFAGVQEAAAVATAGALGEDDIRLFALPQAGVRVEPSALFAHLEPRLARFMWPRYIDVVDEFPRTPTLRIQKFKLRELPLSEHTWTRGRRRGSP